MPRCQGSATRIPYCVTIGRNNETGRRAVHQGTGVALSIYFTVTEAYTG